MLRIGPNATSDENSAINIRKDNQRVGIQKDPTGEYILDVSGAINCDAILWVVLSLRGQVEAGWRACGPKTPLGIFRMAMEMYPLVRGWT